MRWKQALQLRLRSLFYPESTDKELDEELQYHLERQIDKNISEGMNGKDARYAALRSLGAIEARKEECRDSRGTRWLQDLLQDLSYATRTLSHAPVFSIVATLVLALAVGVNTAVFTLVNGVLLRSLPFEQPDRLVLLASIPQGLVFEPGPIMLDRDYLEFRRHSHSFESLAAVGSTGAKKTTLTGHGEPVILSASLIGPDLLTVLRVRPAIGHGFLADGQPDDNSVLLSRSLWVSRFGGDTAAVGKTLLLDGISYSIRGVMPPTFTFQNADLWIRDEIRLDPHNVFFIPVLGRLKPGVSARQAQAELAIFSAGLPRDRELNRRGYVSRILPLKDMFVSDVRKLLLIFSGAVGFVFLIACANFANLLLIRGAGRQPEMAVRAALGASRWRLVRQLITESTLLSLLGAALGLQLSRVGVHALLALLPPDRIPASANIHADVSVCLVAVGLALVTGLVFGLTPALQATRRELREGLTQGGRTLLAKREGLRGMLVSAEIALALILLTGAGLLVKSFLKMRAVHPGFQSANLAVATLDLPATRYRTTAALQSFDEHVLDGLSAMPDVQSAAAVSFLPFGYGVMGTFLLEDGQRLPEGYSVDKPEISGGYFRTMGISIVSGRGFTERDSLSAPGVVIVSESVARKFWPHGEVLGKRIAMEEHPNAADWLTIVGVAGDVRQTGITDKSKAVIYQPYQQVKMPGFLNHISFVVRSRNLTTMAAGMQAIIRRLDKDLPVESITTMDSIVAGSLTGTLSQTRLLGIFSVMALLLAAIGVHGVLAYSVGARTHEIGMRMAVGAGRYEIVLMVLRQTISVTAKGLLIGLLGALALTRVLTGFLFDVTPTDPLTFVTVTIVLVAVALFAAWIPVRRAANVQPLEALRHE